MRSLDEFRWGGDDRSKQCRDEFDWIRLAHVERRRDDRQFNRAKGLSVSRFVPREKITHSSVENSPVVILPHSITSASHHSVCTIRWKNSTTHFRADTSDFVGVIQRLNSTSSASSLFDHRLALLPHEREMRPTMRESISAISTARPPATVRCRSLSDARKACERSDGGENQKNEAHGTKRESQFRGDSVRPRNHLESSGINPAGTARAEDELQYNAMAGICANCNRDQSIPHFCAILSRRLVRCMKYGHLSRRMVQAGREARNKIVSHLARTKGRKLKRFLRQKEHPARVSLRCCKTMLCVNVAAEITTNIIPSQKQFDPLPCRNSERTRSKLERIILHSNISRNPHKARKPNSPPKQQTRLALSFLLPASRQT